MITYKISRLPPPIRPVHIFNPMYIKRKKRCTALNSIPIDWELQSRVIGEGITIFTFTYCTLNWMFYRKIRKQVEENNEKDTKKKDE